MGHRDESREGTTPNSHTDTTEDWELEEVLDQALSQLNSGDDLEHILARFPTHAGLLRPMLRVAQLIRHVVPPVPDVAARQAGLNRLVAAVRVRQDLHAATVLDSALEQLAAGEALETILADRPAWANSPFDKLRTTLRPMLKAAIAISETPQPIPDQQKKDEGRERLLRAVATLRQARQLPETSRTTFEEALDEALAWLREGLDVETVLAGYPTFAARMRPLLQAAENVQQVSPPVPDEDAYFAGRERLVRLALQRRRERQGAEAPVTAEQVTWASLLQPVRKLLAGFLGITPHVRRAAITVVMLVAMLLGGFSVTQVAADSLPTSPLYGVKRFSERVQLALTPSTEGKAKLHLQFSQERLREAETLAHQTGRVNPALLGDMLKENDQFLGKIKEVAPEQQEELLANGAKVFYQQRRALTRLSGDDSPLSPSERAVLSDFVGEAGDDQAMAEEVQRDLNLAEMIPSPTPLLLPTVTLRPSPTSAPTRVQAPARPTAVPATATPVPPTATPAQAPAEMVLEPAGPEVLSSATSTATARPGLTATPTATATSAPVSPPHPIQATATPTPAPPPATPTPEATATEVTPNPTTEIGMPTIPPPTDTPVP